MDRQKTIVRTSLTGILANLLLAATKALVGLAAHSIAIVLDAVNNLSDALSSVITIIGTKLAGKEPDKKHPYGHGRIEYISATIIAVIILYAGISSLVESIRKILHPQTPRYAAYTLILIAVAVLVKLLLGRFVGRVGKKVQSESLVASGKDARNDAIISAATLVAAGIFLLFGVSLEAWLAAAISVFIILSGIGILKDTLSLILGERIDSELSLAIKRTISDFPDVAGAYDLILHSYGPDMMMGSVHIEIPDTYTAAQIDELERGIVERVAKKHGVILTGISIYSQNTTNDEAAAIRENIRHIVMAHDNILQMHGFYLTEDTIQFDIVVAFEARDRSATYQHIVDEISADYPNYKVQVTMDNDMSE